MLEILFLAIGLALTLFSGETVVRAAQKIAKHFGISESFIGLTILSIGTSLAEISAHLAASYNILKGDDPVILSGIAVGTNIGSNIIQITAILGIVALALRLKASKKFMKHDYMVMLASIILVFIFGFNGSIGREEGLILVCAYLAYLYHLAKAEEIISKVESNHQGRIGWQWLYLSTGILILVYSANMVVKNAELLAIQWNVAGSLVGALIIGLGTALPELTTSIIAIMRKSKDMGLGVLVGSNITNPLFALGLGAMVSPYFVSPAILYFQLPFWFIVSTILYFFFMKGKRISRLEAITMIGLYFLYVVLSLIFLS